MSSPERLRDDLERTHSEISQLREFINFCRARGRAPPDHYFRDLDILHSRYDQLSLALAESRRLSLLVAVAVLQSSLLQGLLLQLMLPVLHVQIRHLSEDLACHPSLVLPLLANSDSQPKIVVVLVTPPAISLVPVAFQRSAITNDSLLAPGIATVGDSVQGIPLLLGEWDLPQGTPPLQSEWDSPQGVPPLQSEWDSPQGVPHLQSEWDSPQGVPPLQSERDSLQGIPPLQSDGVSLQGTLFHLDVNTHPVLRLVMALFRDPHRGLLLPIHLLLRGKIRKLMNRLFQPRLGL